MNALITITQRELLSLAPEIRSQVRDGTITRRLPNKDTNTSQNLYQAAEEEEEDEHVAFYQGSPTRVPSPKVNSVHYRTPPEGSIVIKDPIETYYCSLEPGEIPDPNQLVVAMESSAVRSVYALVRHRSEEGMHPQPWLSNSGYVRKLVLRARIGL